MKRYRWTTERKAPASPGFQDPGLFTSARGLVWVPGWRGETHLALLCPSVHTPTFFFLIENKTAALQQGASILDVRSPNQRNLLLTEKLVLLPCGSFKTWCFF